MRRYRVGILAGVLAMTASAASAQVTTERSASILVFPKVIANGTRDTIIQITNTSNSMVHAHCFYVNAAPANRDLPPDPVLNPPLWQELDFDIWLTKQQPTHWVVSRGRAVNPQDPSCDRLTGTYDCPDAGLDPGRVPPVPDDFVGELKCVEVDASGAPISGNHLKGEATVITQDVCGPQLLCANDWSRCMTDNDCVDGAACVVGGNRCELTDQECGAPEDCDSNVIDEAKYNGLGIIGNENNNGDPVLCLGGETSDACQTGAEYDACPETWIVNHQSYGAPDLAVGSPSFVATSLTLVPCEQNFETQDPESVTLQLLTYNEFEQQFSSSTTLTCWADLKLTDINNLFRRTTLASDFAQTRIRPSSGTQSGILLVGTETHYVGERDLVSDAMLSEPGEELVAGRPRPPYATASFNAHIEGERIPQDLITIPAEQIQ
jgi:hypothetical protein